MEEAKKKYPHGVIFNLNEPVTLKTFKPVVVNPDQLARDAKKLRFNLRAESIRSMKSPANSPLNVLNFGIMVSCRGKQDKERLHAF